MNNSTIKFDHAHNTDKAILKQWNEMHQEETRRIMESYVYKEHLRNGFCETTPQRFCSEFDVFYFIVTYTENNIINIPITPALRSYSLAQSCLKGIKKYIPNAGISMHHCHFVIEEENCSRRVGLLNEILDEYTIIHRNVLEAIDYWKSELEHMRIK